MITMASSKVISHFEKVCDQVIEDNESVLVERANGENIVLISESEYNNMRENLRIFSNRERYGKIKNGIDQLEEG